MEIQNNFNLKLESKVINISLIILFLTMFHASGPWFYYMVHIVDVRGGGGGAVDVRGGGGAGITGIKNTVVVLNNFSW